MSKEIEKTQEFVQKLKEHGYHWKNNFGQIRPLTLAAAVCNIGLLWMVSDRVQQVSGASFPAPGLTPRAGAMTVFGVENRFRTAFSFTATITDTNGFYYQGSPKTVNPCSVENFPLKDMPEIPSPFLGAMTISSDDAPGQFRSEISGYDYPGQSPDPLAKLTTFVLVENGSTDGSSVVDVRNIQKQVDLINLTVCDSLYSELADVTDGQGNPYRDGVHSVSDLQMTAEQWNNRLSLSSGNNGLASRLKSPSSSAALSVGTSANISLDVPTNPISVGEPFTVKVNAKGLQNVRAFQLGIEYDPTLEFLGNTVSNQVNALADGKVNSFENAKRQYQKPMIKSVFMQGTSEVLLNAGIVAVGPVVEGGKVVVGMYSQGAVPEINGDSTLEYVTLRANTPGNFVLKAVEPKISQRFGIPQPVQLADGSVVRIVPNIPEPTVTATPVATPRPSQTPGPYKNYIPSAANKAN